MEDKTKINRYITDYKKSVTPPYRKNDFFAIGATFLVLLLALFFAFSLPTQFKDRYTKQQQAAGTSPCQFQKADQPMNIAFCETFDNPSPINSRAGQLNSTVWGVSRLSQIFNFGQSLYNEWAPTTLQNCDGTTPTVMDPNDVTICNGQIREASNDNVSGGFEGGVVTVLAMYPKQPFDFAGRTGTVTFDVSNDTHGSHAAWPEFWLTDLPIPAPFTHPSGAMISVPQNGFGIRFASVAAPGQGPVIAPHCPNDTNKRWTIESAIVVRNYAIDDSEFSSLSSMRSVPDDCVIEASGPNGPLNHVEIRISQNQVDVYATDPGATSLHHLGTITNANLTLTRGLVWLEDAHYNADKADINNPSLSQRQHTFTWDNVGFDGPYTYRDDSHDALDALTNAASGGKNLGKFSAANKMAIWNVLNMPANPQATAVRVLFNLYHYTAPSVINIMVNGHSHTQTWPYNETTWGRSRTDAITIPITDLVAGTNAVKIGGDQDMATSNVNIVLVHIPDTTTTPSPTSITSPTGALTSTPTSAPSATPTPTLTILPTATSIPTPSATPTLTPIPTATIFGVGDINHDNKVDLVDFSILLSDWNSNNTRSDLNHDGGVNIQDMSILLSHWGQ